ncbi:MAG: hypothetical protein II411_02505, partial [Lachnospiraceae bacterium]|nr:hypothetical protein [Lachnospiraceae bacterium]
LVGFIIAVLVLKNKKVKTLYKNLLVVMVLLMLAIMISARDYSYYLIVLLPFISFALNSFIVVICLNANKDNKLFMLNRSLLLTSIVIIISLVCLNINFGSRRMVDNYKNREKFIKFVESAYTERRASNKKDKLLVIGEELYLYNYFNILPSFKHFCIPIIEIDYMMQPYLETLKYVDSAAADIIVIGDGASVYEFKNYTDLQSIVNNRYDVIDMKDGRWVLQAKG